MDYNRVLHPDDYRDPALAPHVEDLDQFEAARMQGLPYRKDHTHRRWEYGLILRQLRELFPDRDTKDIRILDTGSGASYFPPYLKTLGYDIAVSDSMAYGDIVEWLRTQCFGLGITIPLIVAPVEQLGLEDNQWDVTMCISVIEHLSVEAFAKGLQELYRVTKPGGYLFITSDFFESEARALESPSLGIQHNRFYPHNVEAMIKTALPDVEFVGAQDFTYRGDFVHNYSFLNICLQKPAGV